MSEKTDDFDDLPISTLKERLTALRVRYDTCIEKQDFVALLRRYSKGGSKPSQPSQPSSQSTASPPPPPQPKPAASRVPSRPASSSSSSSTPPRNNGEGFNWQQAILGVLVLYFVATKVFGIGGGKPWGEEYGGGGGGGTHDYVPGDHSYLKGKVVEVASHEQFNHLMGHLKASTGLPLIVDFYSPSCGPCVMIAPTFQQLAKVYAKRAVFVKVNVNSNGETSSVYQVRSMPTFVYILNEKVIHRFSGADSGRLRQLTEAVAVMAENHGTYVEKEITPQSLANFYKEHDASKVSQVADILEKHGDKTALLMSTLKHKYGKGPEVSQIVEKKPPVVPPKEDLAKTSEDAKPPVSRDSSPEEQAEEAEELAVELFVKPPYTTQSGNPANPEKVVIIGGGPAGLSAAIYAARAGLSPVVIAPMFGGQLLGKGVDVENFPGVVGEQSTGRGLVSIMRLQAHGFNTRLVNDAVLNLDVSTHPFRLFLNESKEAVFTHSIIFATGADSKWLGVSGEHEHRGHGVSSCATCDGFLYKGQHVVVIGGGDAAMEDALVLARTSSSVIIVHRGEHFRASHILAERVKQNPKIRILWQHTAIKFEGVGSTEEDKKLTSVTLAHTVSGKTQTLSVGAAFIAIGHSPNTSILKGLLDMDEQGYLVTRGRSTKTSVDGIFAAGDVADRVYRQAVTSAGTGAAASLDAERWLSEHGYGAI